MNLSLRLGAVILGLFGVPFAVAGLFSLAQGLGLTSGTGQAPVGMAIAFGLTFSTVGFGIIFLALYGGRHALRKQRLEVEHPTEPWLWRADWAQGRVKSKTGNLMFAGWAFAIFWNAISMPIALLVLPAAAKQKGSIAYIALVFPIAGVFLLIHAMRETIAFFEFGKTYFEMASVPAVVGRELKGQIQARFPHSPDHGIHLRFSSVHRVTTNSGNSSSTTETILWRDEADLSSAQVYPGPTGTTIPVDFRIPWNSQPTEQRNARDEYVWVLEALADVPGVNYHDIFEVPVFRTKDTPAAPEAETFAAAKPAAVPRPEALTVKVRQLAQGTEFYFPAARNKNFATTTTAFMLVFGAITFFLIHHAPLIFPLAFGFFSLLLLYIAIQMWLGTSRVVMGSGGVTVQAGLLGGGKARQFALSEISAIGDRITAQQGGATGTPYYNIELTLRDGKKVTLGSTLRDQHEAAWLVEEMQRLAGLQPKSVATGTA